MPELKKILFAGLIFIYIVIAVVFAFSSDGLAGMAGATGNIISELPYGSNLSPNAQMLILPGLLLVLSIVVVIIYLKSD